LREPSSWAEISHKAVRRQELESKGKALSITVIVIAGAFLSLIAMLAALNRRDQLVGLNKEIQYDDFAFSITGVRKMKAIGTGESGSIAQGDYYLVSLLVSNHAMRVDYSFKNDTAVLVDQQGREFHFSPVGQRALEASQGTSGCGSPIPAGSSCTTELVFDLPAESKPGNVRISGGTLGDLLEVIFFGNKRIDVSSVVY
jgi:hypothetical protein